MSRTTVFVAVLVSAVTLAAHAGGGGMGGMGAGNSRGFAGATLGGAAPAARTVAPNHGPMSVTMDSEYGILTITSIFAENRRGGRGGQPPPPPGTNTGTEQGTNPPPRRDAPIFRGVVTDETGTQAVLEVQEGDARAGAVRNTIASYKAGQTFQWNGTRYTVLGVDLDKGMTLEQGGGPLTISLGKNILNQAMAPLPDMPLYRSPDALPQKQNDGYTGRGRTGSSGGMVGGTSGGAGGFSMASLQSALVSSSDPPLPPGSADDLASRMKQRREMQLAAPGGAPVTTPTGSMTTPATTQQQEAERPGR